MKTPFSRRSPHGLVPACIALACLVALASVPAAVAAVAAARDIPATQEQYRLVRNDGGQGYKLELTHAAVRLPGEHEVLIRVRATSLNRRDVFVMKGQYPVGSRESIVPLSDGAGEIVAIGHGVTRFRVGDRVAGIFFQNWLTGRPPEKVASGALGGSLDGMLTQYVTLSEEGVVHLPKSLSFEEGSTLPCVGVTAWNGLFTRGRIQPGDYVLLEGTGGVSTFGLKLALAAGAKPIITSSSDAKLERAKALGAFGTINYRTTPDWEKPVLALTGGVGVHEVLEVGGKDTLPHALASIAPGGDIALIGGLGGFGGNIPALQLLDRNVDVSGIYVGSRENFEALNAFIDQHKVKPVIDKVFDFKDAPAAYELMESDQFLGKIVIRL